MQQKSQALLVLLAFLAFIVSPHPGRPEDAGCDSISCLSERINLLNDEIKQEKNQIRELQKDNPEYLMNLKAQPDDGGIRVEPSKLAQRASARAKE